MASIIEGVEAPSQLVAVAAGFGQGDPASWVYELDPETPMLVFGHDSDPDNLMSEVLPAVDLWITFSSEKASLPVELELVRRLEESGRYTVAFRNRAAVHLIRGASP